MRIWTVYGCKGPLDSPTVKDLLAVGRFDSAPPEGWHESIISPFVDEYEWAINNVSEYPDETDFDLVSNYPPRLRGNENKIY